MDSWPKTYVLWFGDRDRPQITMYPYHLGTQLDVAKELMRERFNSKFYAEYETASLYLDGKFVYGIGRPHDDEDCPYCANSDRERFGGRQ